MWCGELQHRWFCRQVILQQTGISRTPIAQIFSKGTAIYAEFVVGREECRLLYLNFLVGDALPHLSDHRMQENGIGCMPGNKVRDGTPEQGYLQQKKAVKQRLILSWDSQSLAQRGSVIRFQRTQMFGIQLPAPGALVAQANNTKDLEMLCGKMRLLLDVYDWIEGPCIASKRGKSGKPAIQNTRGNLISCVGELDFPFDAAQVFFR